MADRLNIVYEVAEPDAQGFGDPHQGVNAYRLLAAFNLPEINGMQVRLFGQLFLAHFCGLAMPTDGFADDFLMEQAFRHALSPKQEGG
jgi:hypothetical protein